LPFDPAVAARYASDADASIAAQADLEAKDNVPFEAYRRQYLGLDVMSGLPG
jgi:hypothetical protein